jgi:hypothetical protein
MDGTGLGDVVQQHLQKENIRFDAIIMSAPTKMKMYTDFISVIEKGELHWDNDKYPLIQDQLLSLEREVKLRTIAYNACEGAHDDICDAMAFVIKGLYDHPELNIHSFSIGAERVIEHNPWIELDIDDCAWWE